MSVQSASHSPSPALVQGASQTTVASSVTVTPQTKEISFIEYAQEKKAASFTQLEEATFSKPTEATIGNFNALSEAQVSADIFTFMALFQKLAQTMRNTAREQRGAEMQSQVSALQGAAAEMKSAAKSRFTGAMLQGAMQIGTGALQMGLSSAAAKNQIKGTKLDSMGTKMLKEAKADNPLMGAQRKLDLKTDGTLLKNQGASFTAIGDKQTSRAQAISGASNAIGTIFSAGFNFKADMHDAKRTEFETQAKVHETAVQHTNDALQQQMDVIRDIRDKTQAMQQSAIETNRGISRNI